MTIDFLLNKYVLKFIPFDIVASDPNMKAISNILPGAYSSTTL